MRIGVVSDTHDRVETAMRALDELHLAGSEIIVHCGDVKTPETLQLLAEKCISNSLPLYTVLGNNDKDIDGLLAVTDRVKEKSIVVAAGVLEVPTRESIRVVAYHGHHLPTLRRLRDDTSIDVLLLGHTHKPTIEDATGRLILNPGSLAFAIPRSREWKASYAMIDTETLTATLRYLS
jgi:putative phosphoesterase